MSKKTKSKLDLTELTAITTVDGRYRGRIAELAHYVSEYGLIRTRFEIEAKYLIALSDFGIIRKLTKQEMQRLESFGQNIDLPAAERVKAIESETRHDVKAMEKSFREMVKGTSLEDLTESIHFGLTSEDINNLAYRLILKRATADILIPTLNGLIDKLVGQAQRYQKTPMLARTHGQAAVSTTVGKELVVFAARLNSELEKLQRLNLRGKLNGAVGNFNALQAAYPDADWIKFSEKFVSSFGLEPNLATTQINTYEDIIEYFQNYGRINGIIIDFDQDMWRYISDDWFVQEVKKGEVGSSTMPQKVNPIDFENSEGNLTVANALLEGASRKLSTSRLQRDLSDSTIIRNIGTVLAFSLVGYKSTQEGLSRVRPNETEMASALNSDWMILTEAVQTILRKAGVKDPYSMVAPLSRGEHIDEEKWQQFLDNLPLDDEQKNNLRELTPKTYIGLAVKITRKAIEEIKSSRKK